MRQATFFDNELSFIATGAGSFPLRMYIFGAGDHTPVHDHTSWGVSGSAFGELEVVRYRREDDGSDPEGPAGPAGNELPAAGATEITRAFDEGIHKTGNPSAATTL